MMDLGALRQSQRAYFDAGKTLPVSDRLEALGRLEETICRRQGEILEALRRDLGKPEIEAYLSEVYFLLSEIRLFRKRLRRWVRPRGAAYPFFFFPALNRVRREPFGCALVIAPWNYPVQLSLSPLLSAIGAGNTVILKPSEQAPASSEILASIVEESFPPEHAAVVEGDVEVAKALLEEPFDFIFFTGSERVGKVVAKAAAGHLAPTVLELGGKCPVIIDSSADLDIAARRIAAAKWFNAGQTCFAPDFILAPREIRPALANGIAEVLNEFARDDPRSDFGRILNSHHFDRLQQLLPGASGQIVIGEDDREDRFFAPRVLPEATWECASMKEEIFGPILPLVAYDNEDEIVPRLRGFGAPLALYLFTRRRDFREHLRRALPSGAICVNDLAKQSSNLSVPFGGVGSSGMGRYRGRYGFEAFTYQRPETVRFFVRDLFAVQPPYAGKLEQFRRFLR